MRPPLMTGMCSERLDSQLDSLHIVALELLHLLKRHGADLFLNFVAADVRRGHALAAEQTTVVRARPLMANLNAGLCAVFMNRVHHAPPRGQSRGIPDAGRRGAARAHELHGRMLDHHHANAALGPLGIVARLHGRGEVVLIRHR